MRPQFIGNSLSVLRSPRVSTFERHTRDDVRTAVIAIVTGAASAQQEVRWHVAQMLPRLPLTGDERATAAAALVGYLDDRSSFVRTFALDALAQLARDDEELRGRVLALLREAEQSGSAAVRSRARKLLAELG